LTSSLKKKDISTLANTKILLQLSSSTSAQVRFYNTAQFVYLTNMQFDHHQFVYLLK